MTPKTPERRSSGASQAAEGGGYQDLSLDQQLCLALQIATSEVTRIYRELLEPLGLTYPQYLVLLALWERPRSTMGDLRRALNMDTGTLTPLVKRMEKAGLVVRVRDSSDERRVWVDLNQPAWALRDKLKDIRTEAVRRLPLSSDQLGGLRATLQAMNEQLLKKD